jgi:hypothetical protein
MEISETQADMGAAGVRRRPLSRGIQADGETNNARNRTESGSIVLTN